MMTPAPQNGPAKIGDISFWFQEIGGPPQVLRPALIGEAEADICIIGAGYTGLWSAYYLKKAAPHLRITVLEQRFAGFGASGRNGGWLTGGFAWNHGRYARDAGEDAVRAMVRAMNGTVEEVIRVARAEGIEADILPTDELLIATNPAQLARLQDELALRSHWGEAARLSMLSADAVAERIKIPGSLGALRISDVARIQPAKLVRGLADAVERLGVVIHEGSKVTTLAPGQVETTGGRLRAKTILRCTEGFTATLPGLKREWLPLNSAQIVTQPLSPETWAKIGWQGNEIIGDFAHSYCYCQRTASGRITVGARGIPYRFGSRLDHDGTPDAKTIRQLMAVLARHFPAAAGARIDHAWCGTLGVPRDWCASLGYDPATGMGFAGGYVGIGVSTSNLSGRVLCDLVLGRDSDLTRLAFVNRPTRRWEPEPLRWLGVRGMYAGLGIADRQEARPGAGPSKLAALAYRLAGR